MDHRVLLRILHAIHVPRRVPYAMNVGATGSMTAYDSTTPYLAWHLTVSLYICVPSVSCVHMILCAAMYTVNASLHHRVEDSFIGLIIGSGGANIKAVQQKTGCDVRMVEGGNVFIAGPTSEGA